MTDARTSRLASLEARRSALLATLSELSSQRAALIDDFTTSYRASLTPTAAAAAAPANTASAPAPPASAPSLSPSQSPACSPNAEDSAVAAAHAVIKEHIRLLQRYNDIKDVGQGLMGLVAEQRDGARVVHVMAEFGMDDGD